jgi:hypothetical protein
LRDVVMSLAMVVADHGQNRRVTRSGAASPASTGRR